MRVDKIIVDAQCSEACSTILIPQVRWLLMSSRETGDFLRSKLIGHDQAVFKTYSQSPRSPISVDVDYVSTRAQSRSALRVSAVISTQSVTNALQVTSSDPIRKGR